MKAKIQKVIEDCRIFIQEEQDVKLIFEDLTGDGDVFVEADKSKLFEVLSNLIRNSIKFTNKGVITVILEQSDGNVQVSVKDTGSGIDPEISPKLFEKFTTKGEKGTGLGLYISKNIIEAHGGSIWAENNPDGNGATFTFTLPMAKKEKPEARTSA
jgi:signal transduction histidine kinase